MSVSVKIMTVPGASLEGLNPLPKFHSKGMSTYQTAENFKDELKDNLGIRARILPYKVQDRYSRKRLPLKMKTIVMENEYLKATFWPENGGRLYSLFDKVTGRELLMSNPVYQPGNLAIRNAWFSGGIEWNVSCIGHNVFTCDHLFAAILKDDQGNDFVRIYEFERSKSIVFQVDFHLPAGSPILFAHVKLFNPSNEDTTTYWWTNIAVPEDGHTRVLSSEDHVILFTAENGAVMSYEKLPYVSVFGGKDLSYPSNGTRTFDYFFQTPSGKKTTWEASAQTDGLVFYDRCTAPLLYHKVFAWGNHRAGEHWQEFLAEPGQGYYIELQAGIARTQLHDKPFPAKSTYEWTQCFGGAMLDPGTLHQESWPKANAYMNEYIDQVISEKALFDWDSIFVGLAEKEVKEVNLIHCGSGWGALEELRIEIEDENPLPKSVCFPRSTIGPEQYPWYALLTEGKLPEDSPEVIPPSWMVSPKWMKLLEKSIKTYGETWYNMLHYGVMLNEQMDEIHVANQTVDWAEYPAYAERAKKAFLRSVELTPSVWALRCLFIMEQTEGNMEAAEDYYDRVFDMEAATVDFAFAAEFISFLNDQKKYQKAWKLYCTLPEHIQSVDRMMLCASQAAIKLRKMDFISRVFEREYADIREGETFLTDLWFEFCALKMAKERGLPDDINGEELKALIDEAWDTCPPPKAIDFRMSYDRKNKYRVGDNG